MNLNLNRDKVYVVGYSGGVDSLALCLLLQAQGYNFKAVHVNHQTEKYAEFDEYCAKTIYNLYEHLSVEVEVIEAPVNPNLVKSHGLEAAMRRSRYDALIGRAFLDASAVLLTGHHADDQVETIMIQMFRGTGVSGLTGIDEHSTVTNTDGFSVDQIRPLLKFSKDQLIKVVTSHNGMMHVIQDPSNSDMTCTRSRVRATILPALKEAFGEAQVHRAISKMVANMKEAEDLLDLTGKTTFDRLNGWVDTDTANAVAYVSLDFLKLGTIEKKNVLMYMAKQIGLRLTTRHLDEILRQHKHGRPDRCPTFVSVPLAEHGEFLIDLDVRVASHNFRIELRNCNNVYK